MISIHPSIEQQGDVWIKDAFVLILPTEKRFVSEQPTGNQMCLRVILPTLGSFLENSPTEEQKRLEATQI